MEEKFRIAFEEARKNGENEEIIKRDEEEIQNAISEQQKIYIEWQRISSDVRRIFNVSSEEVREYSNNIQDLFDRLKVINDIIDKNAKAYGVTIEKGELPFNEDALEKPVEQNYFSAPVVPVVTMERTNAPQGPEVVQPQAPRPEGPESAQPQAPKSEGPETVQPQVQKPEGPENAQPQAPRPEGPEVAQSQDSRPEGPETTQPQDSKPEGPEVVQPQTQNPEKENQMKVTKKDLELAKKANDFYCGRMNGHKFSKEDMLFFANNTLEDIKKKYGENIFPVTKEEEELFDKFIKYQSLKDGLHMTKEDRDLMTKNRDAIFYNKDLVDPEAKKLYDRFFKDCNGDEYEIALRYNSLSIMGGKIDDIYKKIEEEFMVNNLNEPEPINPAPVDPNPVGPAPVGQEPTEPAPIDPNPAAPESVGPEPVGPVPADSNPVGPIPVVTAPVGSNPVGPAPTGPNPVGQAPVSQPLVYAAPVMTAPVNNAQNPQTPIYSRANVKQPKITNKSLRLNVKVLGKKMLVNGKEYEYKTEYGENINQEIAEIFDQVHDSPLFTKFISKDVKDELIDMSGSLKDKYPDGKILDPNIVYAIVEACKDMININGTDEEREKSIEDANEYFKKLMYQYMRYASGNFVKGLGFNDLAIEYNLKEAMKLDEEDKKVIKEWAEISKDYAKIVDIGFLQKIISKIKSIFSKKNKPLLGEGQSDDKKGQPQDKDGAKQPEAGQVQPAIPEQDTSFVQKLPLEQQNQQAPTQTSPEPSRHINLPNRNDEHGNMEP